MVVSDFDKIYAPKLINRESYYRGVIYSENAPFAVHLKCNGHFNLIPEEYGGHQNYLYFVHSFYGADCDESTIAVTEYSATLTAAVRNGSVYGCQFHPEKSGNVGLDILRAFCEI